MKSAGPCIERLKFSINMVALIDTAVSLHTGLQTPTAPLLVP